MKKYKYAHVSYPNRSSVVFFSPDSNLLQTFLSGIKKSFPNSNAVIQFKDLSDNPVQFYVTGLSGKDPGVGTWVIQQLLINGWEPFAATDGQIHFRIVETD